MPGFDECEDDREDDDEFYDPPYEMDDGILDDRCVLGAACLVADPYHSADECFDAEMARHFMGDASEPNPDGKP